MIIEKNKTNAGAANFQLKGREISKPACVCMCVHSASIYIHAYVYIESYEIIRWRILGGARRKKYDAFRQDMNFRVRWNFYLHFGFFPLPARPVAGIFVHVRGIFFPGKKRRPAGDVSPATVPARFHFPRFDGRLTQRREHYRYSVFFSFFFLLNVQQWNSKELSDKQFDKIEKYNEILYVCMYMYLHMSRLYYIIQLEYTYNT